VQLPAMIAQYFESSLDSAFSVYKLMQSMGSLFSFFLSPLMSFEANLLAVTIYLFVALLSLLRLHASRAATATGYDTCWLRSLDYNAHANSFFIHAPIPYITSLEADALVGDSRKLYDPLAESARDV
jgi:hypothetical protein